MIQLSLKNEPLGRDLAHGAPPDQRGAEDTGAQRVGRRLGERVHLRRRPTWWTVESTATDSTAPCLGYVQEFCYRVALLVQKVDFPMTASTRG